MPDDIELIPDPLVAQEMGVSLMTLWRWDRDREMIELGWPPRIQLRKRNYRDRRSFEKFKHAALRRAIKTRNSPEAA